VLDFLINSSLIAVFGFTARAPPASSLPGTIRQTWPQWIKPFARVPMLSAASFLDACGKRRISTTNCIAAGAEFVHPIHSPLPRVKETAFSVSTRARIGDTLRATEKGARKNWQKSHGGSQLKMWRGSSFQAQRKVHRWPPQEEPRREEQRDVHRRPPQEEPRRAQTIKMSCRCYRR